MSLAAPERESFWRASLRAFSSFVAAEWQWVVCYAIVIALEELLVFPHFNTEAMTTELKAVSYGSAKSIEIVNRYLPFIIEDTAVRMVTVAVGFYSFSVLYLRHSIQSTVPGFSGSSIIHWIKKGAQKFLALLVPAFGAVLLIGSAIMLSQYADKVGAKGFLPALMQLSSVVLFLIAVASVACLVWMSFRLYLVTPMALLRVEPALKLSWRLTQDQSLRIFWGAVIVTFAVFFMLYIPFVVAGIAAKVSGASPLQMQALVALSNGALRSAANVMGAVYVCNVYRILLSEQKSEISTPTVES